MPLAKRTQPMWRSRKLSRMEACHSPVPSWCFQDLGGLFSLLLEVMECEMSCSLALSTLVPPSCAKLRPNHCPAISTANCKSNLAGMSTDTVAVHMPVVHLPAATQKWLILQVPVMLMCYHVGCCFGLFCWCDWWLEKPPRRFEAKLVSSSFSALPIIAGGHASCTFMN